MVLFLFIQIIFIVCMMERSTQEVNIEWYQILPIDGTVMRIAAVTLF